VQFGPLALIGLGLLGISRPFAPTPLGGQLMIGLAVVSGVGATIAIFVGMFVRRGIPPANPRWNQPWRRHPLAIAATSLLLGSGAAFVGLAIGALIACTYTDLAGAPGQQVDTVTADIHASRGCDNFDLREPQPMLHALCATPEQFDASPPGSQLVLVGKTSVLGTDVESYHPADSPPP
jgi:hypothetical protein